MARPQKEGLEYFTVYVNIFESPKMMLLGIEHYTFGQMCYLRLLPMVYAKGYYLKMTKDELALTLTHLIPEKHKSVDRTLQVINYMAKIGLIDRDLAEIGIITSEGFQEGYLACTQRRKPLDKYDYWLLDVVPNNDLSDAS